MAGVWWLMLGLGIGVFVLFLVLLIIGLFRNKGPNRRLAEWGLIVGGGTILPLVVVTIIFGVSLGAMGFFTVGSHDPVEIHITGHQWWWEVTYPDAGVTTANEVHMPADRPVKLHLTSADVVHSFWVPSLGGKLDLLPDKVTTMEFSADEPGEYRGVCAEFCGTQHAKMGFVAVAESHRDFQQWLEAQAQPSDPPEGDTEIRGREVFLDVGCGDCHTIQGSDAIGDVGPDLTHLASRETLAAATLANTPGHLAEWVGNPQQVKEGVNMPDLTIGDEDMAALLGYLESLE